MTHAVNADGSVRVMVFVDRLRTMQEMREWFDSMEGVRYTHPPLGSRITDWAARLTTPWVIDFPDVHAYTLYRLKFDIGDG